MNRHILKYDLNMDVIQCGKIYLNMIKLSGMNIINLHFEWIDRIEYELSMNICNWYKLNMWLNMDQIL